MHFNASSAARPHSRDSSPLEAFVLLQPTFVMSQSPDPNPGRRSVNYLKFSLRTWTFIPAMRLAENAIEVVPRLLTGAAVIWIFCRGALHQHQHSQSSSPALRSHCCGFRLLLQSTKLRLFENVSTHDQHLRDKLESTRNLDKPTAFRKWREHRTLLILMLSRFL